jgi:hypothetical protein
MKNIFTILGCCFVMSVIAQPEIVNYSDTIYVSLDTLNALHSGEISTHWDVANESTSEMTLMCTRHFIEIVDPYNYPYVQSLPENPVFGAYEKFCWGIICYNYGTDASSTNPSLLVSIPPGATESTFIAYYNPDNVTGTTTIEYCFHPVDDIAVGSCSQITYVVSAGEIYGCTSTFGCNYNPEATIDDGSCEFICYGCTDPGACNYDSFSNLEDDSCEYLSCAGCTNSEACNYNPTASIDNGSCSFTLDAAGNCDKELCNEDLNADGVVSIQDLLLLLSFFGCSSECENDVNLDGNVSIQDLLLILGAFGGTCE